jgi:hypothetical protein
MSNNVAPSAGQATATSRKRRRQWFKGIRKWFKQADAALFSSCLILAFLVVWLAIAALIHSVTLDTGRLNAKPASFPPCKSMRSVKLPLTVAPASPNSAMVIVVGRRGTREERQSGPLAIKNGHLCPGSILSMSTSDFLSSNGQLPEEQIVSWAEVDQYGTHVRIFVEVAPRLGKASGAGGYSGLVSLNDPRAQGGILPVDIHILYPFPSIVLPYALLAAFFGFAWAWLIQNVHSRIPSETGRRLTHLALRVAVILVAAIPVVDVTVLRNPDWQGTLSQYIAIATIAGGAAIAATPTLRALILPPVHPPPGGGNSDQDGTAQVQQDAQPAQGSPSTGKTTASSGSRSSTPAPASAATSSKKPKSTAKKTAS